MKIGATCQIQTDNLSLTKRLHYRCANVAILYISKIGAPMLKLYESDEPLLCRAQGLTGVVSTPKEL